MEEKTTKTTAKPANKEEKTYSAEEVSAIVNKAVQEAMANFKAQNSTPVQTVLKVEMVTLLYLGTFAAGTTVALGKLGSITKAGNTLSVSKDLFLQSMGIPVVDALLRKRELLVIDGLTDEERERFNLAYKKGEILTQKAFYAIMDFPKDEIINIYKQLCKEHKILVAQLYKDAYFERNDSRVNIDTVKELNKVSKTVEPKGLFTIILEDYGRKFAE